jgi:UDP-N-acetylglucosamine--dolichyl-phosphate N-acetylglucosaminephosphotransferase
MIDMLIPLLAVAIGVVSTLVLTPYARTYLGKSGIYGVDQQKESRPKVPTSGGLAVLGGFISTTTVILGLSGLLDLHIIEPRLILAGLCSSLIIALIGFIDDIHIEQDDNVELESAPGDDLIHREGLGKLVKMLMVLPAALPLIVVGAGTRAMQLPFIGTVDWGLLYPLVLLPIGMLFVSNVVNMLEGMNGLGAAMSMITAFTLGLYSLMNGQIDAAVIGFALGGSLLGFLKYNFYPASFLPGDSLTYLCGAVLFAVIVLGNIEKFAIPVFTLYFVEFFLKARSKFDAHSWGILNHDGTLTPQHKKTYSLTHPLMRRGFTEPGITVVIAGVHLVICAATLLFFGFF